MLAFRVLCGASSEITTVDTFHYSNPVLAKHKNGPQKIGGGYFPSREFAMNDSMFVKIIGRRPEIAEIRFQIYGK